MGSEAATVALAQIVLQASPPDSDPGLTSEWLPGALLVVAVVGAGSIWHWRRRRRAGSARPDEDPDEPTQRST